MLAAMNYQQTWRLFWGIALVGVCARLLSAPHSNLQIIAAFVAAFGFTGALVLAFGKALGFFNPKSESAVSVDSPKFTVRQ